jgi:hypothetical protein
MRGLRDESTQPQFSYFVGGDSSQRKPSFVCLDQAVIPTRYGDAASQAPGEAAEDAHRLPFGHAARRRKQTRPILFDRADQDVDRVVALRQPREHREHPLLRA